MRKSAKRFGLILCLAFLLSVWAAYAPAEEASASEAENLTAECTYSSDLHSSFYRSKLSDTDLESAQTFRAGEKVSICWTDATPVKTVALLFYTDPGAYRIQQYDADGNLLLETQGSGFVNEYIDVEQNARKVTVVPEEQIALSALYAFGEGLIPDRHDWAPTPGKVDYMVVAMHPDDDVLFMGAIVPIYTAEQNREGTIFYTSTKLRIRKNEALNGAWTMGLRTMPILGTFRDIPHKSDKNNAEFRKSDVVKELVRIFRKYRPEVVFSHDVNGEYGHWQHILLSRAVREAVPLAADPEYDPETVLSCGTWEVKKLYLHLYPENRISLPSSEPLSAFGGRTAKEVAEEAFQCHQSQLPSRHGVTDEGIYSLSDFGLAYTTVGYDTEGKNDPFEHIGSEDTEASEVIGIAKAWMMEIVEVLRGLYGTA